MNQENGFKVGDKLYTSWGYDQTNYDFCQIVEISKTGKTVICQMCKVRVEEHGAQTEGLIPTEPYGDKFRLQVQQWEGWGNENMFRGSYPFCNGDRESMRLDTFRKYDNKPKHQTLTEFGH